MRIPSVLLHSINHDLNLLVVEEELRLVSVFWEIHQENVPDDRNDRRDDALPNEYPSPSLMASDTIHLHESVRKYTSEATDAVANKVEEGISFRYLPPHIPHGDQEDRGGEEAALKHPEQDPEANQGCPDLREPHPEHDQAKGNGDGGQKRSRAEFASADRGDGVEHYVEREEDEDDDGVTVPDVETEVYVHACDDAGMGVSGWTVKLGGEMNLRHGKVGSVDLVDDIHECQDE